MNEPKQVTRIEHSIEMEATPERVFSVLIDPNMITRYAAGIEGAIVLDMPNGPDDCNGATLELVTPSNNVLRAQVVECDRPHRLAVRDERGITGTWDISDMGDGRVRLHTVIEGPIGSLKAQKLRYNMAVKFQALQAILEDTVGFVDHLPSAEEQAPGPGPV